MKPIYDALLRNIPDYTEFMTAREMDESSTKLARYYPDCVKLTDIGCTRGGSNLYCLQIGNDSKKPNALFLGCPHPNEPIGAMMLEYLSLELAKNQELREAFGYNCYMIKAWDRDGLCLNEKWLKGPFTIENYARNMYRPASHLQVDWTFPLHHHDYVFDAILPETAAVKNLIDEIKPKFIYSLHNSDFGGVYWYISNALPETVYASMRHAAEKQGIPLYLGEPEVPLVPELAPAVFGLSEITELYDLLYETAGPETAKNIGMGTNSASYGKKVSGSFSLMTELPYFVDRRVNDTTPIEYTRAHCLLEKLKEETRNNHAITALLKKSEGVVRKGNLFAATLYSFIGTDLNGTNAASIEADEANRVQATEAERFSTMVEPVFRALVMDGMLVRMFEAELEQQTLSDAEREILEDFRGEAERLFEENNERLSPRLCYDSVAIKKLVAIQLESGLTVADQIRTSEEEA